MKHTDAVIRGALASLIAAGLTTLVAPVQAADMEKCAGVIKAGKNDCGTSHSSCHGSVKTDGDKEAWIALPKGTCERIAGAYVTTSPYARPGGKNGD